MDKYEFSIKAEQIKKLSGQGDYKTAMQIADTIDWNRVRNANLLSSIAEIYEKNGEYEEAKDILLLAFERAPVGKRFLYKLSELSLSSGAIDDAVEFYREFMDVSPEDPRKFLLQYMILKAKGARAEQLVGPLEQFTETELEEQWLYELAKLYGEAGREDDCVRTCDKMILLFGMGKYVDKAMDLKLHYRPLKEEEAPRTIVKEEYDEEPKALNQETLEKVDSERIIGLLCEPEKLSKIRSNRLNSLGFTQLTSYTDLEKIYEELDYSKEVFKKYRAHVINITDKSIEETAFLIEDHLKKLR